MSYICVLAGLRGVDSRVQDGRGHGRCAHLRDDVCVEGGKDIFSGSVAFLARMSGAVIFEEKQASQPGPRESHSHGPGINPPIRIEGKQAPQHSHEDEPDLTHKIDQSRGVGNNRSQFQNSNFIESPRWRAFFCISLNPLIEAFFFTIFFVQSPPSHAFEISWKFPDIKNAC